MTEPTRSGDPLPLARIAILDHTEFGETFSRTDGRFDLAVNGGGSLILQVTRGGFLSSQRQIEVPWRDYVAAEDVALIPLDASVTTIDFSEPVEVARGSMVVSDTSGTRRATLFFDQGTTATAMMPDSSTVPLDTLSVRATEYTVGPNGPLAMPAALPVASAYTYCIEFTADEALVAGARSVAFSQPVSFYVENFLGIPVGRGVPLGYYDRVRAEWLADRDGGVIAVLDTAGGIATIDADGDSLAESGAELDSLGITATDRERLASLYAPGQTLWHAELTHFSTPDFNFGFFLPGDRILTLGETIDYDLEGVIDPECASGSIIECQNQVLGEQVPIVGTPFSLNYRSSRVPGNRALRRVAIPLTGETIPASLLRVHLEVHIAGRIDRQSFPPIANDTTIYEWDGHDAYGRAVPGRQRALVRIGYEYPRIMLAPSSGGAGSSFGRPGLGIALTQSTRTSGIDWFEQTILLGALDMAAAGLGSWTLDVHHAFDPADAGTLFRGDGTTLDGQLTHAIIAGVSPPVRSFALAPDGGRFVIHGTGEFGEDDRVYRVAPDGTETVFAGSGTGFGFGGDGGPATAATLNGPADVALGPDGTVYIADSGNKRLRRVDPNGDITTVAGSGAVGCSGNDGDPGTSWPFQDVSRVAVGSDGTVYFSTGCGGADGVCRLDPDGRVTRVANLPANAASYLDLVTGGDGSLHFAHNTFSGAYEVTRVAADGSPNEISLAVDGPIGTIGSVAVGADGSVYCSLTTQFPVSYLFRVSPSGVTTLVAGNRTQGTVQAGMPATQTPVGLSTVMEVDPEGRLWFLEANLYKITPAAPGFSLDEILRAAADGAEVYVFDTMGRHLRTLDALTGAHRYRFGYDGAHRLVTIRNVDGDSTRIERDGQGQPVAIVGPYGHRTELGVDGGGYLSRIEDPGGNEVTLTADSQGLLREMRDPRQQLHSFDYDGNGLLVEDGDPADGYQTLVRTDSTQAFRVARTSGENRTTTYRVNALASGDQQRVVVDPAGHPTVSVRATSEITTSSSPDGMTSSVTEGPDPRYGMQTPVVTNLTVSTPLDLTATVTTQRYTQTASGPGLRDEVRVNGRLFKSEYTTATRTWVETTPEDRSVTTVVDSAGRPLTVTVPGLAQVQLHYDPRGRLDQTQEGGRIWQYAYDDSGRLARVTDPLLRETGFRYDPSDRLIRQDLPGGRTVSFAYDASGNLTALEPPGKPEHGFGYTPVDLTQRYTPPGAGLADYETRYVYDRDRGLTHVKRPDSLNVTLGYDAAGRLASVTQPRGASVFSYHTSTGNLTGLTSPDTVSLTYSYDGALPLSETWSGAVSGSVSHTYDTDFRPASQSVNGGSTVTFGYDNDGLLTSAGALSLTRSSQHGLLTGTTLGSVTTSQGYNSSGELALYEARYLGALMFRQSYDRDSLGRITQITEIVQDTTVVKEFSYDSAGRLYEVHEDGVLTEHYEYDANGNRTLFQGRTAADTATGTYDDQDRMLRYRSASYTYTANGELAMKVDGADTTGYSYNALGNLITVILPNPHDRIDYLIDGQNRRVGKKLNGVLRRTWLYQNGLNPIAELDSVGNVISRFVYGARGHVPEYLVQGGATYRLVTDQVGSVRLVVDVATGVVAQRIDYDAFGVLRRDSAPSFQPLSFAGGMTERATEFVRFGARDYDPRSGRWTTRDPVGFGAGATQLYEYVSSDPVDAIDASGRTTVAEALRQIPAQLPNVVEGARQLGQQLRGTPLAPVALGLAAGVLVYEIYAHLEFALHKEKGSPINSQGKSCPASELVPTENPPVIEDATNPKARGGSNIEQTYVDQSGGVVTRQTVVSPSGKIIEDHYRPGLPKGGRRP